MWIIYPHNKCDTLEITSQPFVPQDHQSPILGIQTTQDSSFFANQLPQFCEKLSQNGCLTHVLEFKCNLNIQLHKYQHYEICSIRGWDQT